MAINKVDPCLTLFRNKSSLDFVVLNLCIHPEFGFCIAHGPLVRITDDLMQTSVTGVLLANLQGFQGRKPVPAEFDALSSKDRKAYDLNFWDMGVCLREGGKSFLFTPMKPGTRGGRVGEPEDMVSVPSTVGDDVVYRRLVEAYGACET